MDFVNIYNNLEGEGVRVRVRVRVESNSATEFQELDRSGIGGNWKEFLGIPEL
jgi:hypothetical protein